MRYRGIVGAWRGIRQRDLDATKGNGARREGDTAKNVSFCAVTNGQN